MLKLEQENMSGDCKNQPVIFYSDEMTLAKRIVIEHSLANSTTSYTRIINNQLYPMRWRNGSPMQE